MNDPLLDAATCDTVLTNFWRTEMTEYKRLRKVLDGIRNDFANNLISNEEMAKRFISLKDFRQGKINLKELDRKFQEG